MDSFDRSNNIGAATILIKAINGHSNCSVSHQYTPTASTISTAANTDICLAAMDVSVQCQTQPDVGLFGVEELFSVLCVIELSQIQY
ncbi:MAG: hypothetical protein Q8M57_06240 [Nitrosomonas sp.]|nr:hypothetical protein [Nitrosomonas sp.]